MTYKVFSVVVLLFLLAPDASAQASYSRLERQLFQLRREWLNAYLTRDVAALERIEADDFVRVDSDGHIFNKGQDIARIKGAPPPAADDSMDTLESSVRVFGDGAVTTGRLWVRYREASQLFVRQYAFTDTFVKRRGRWQVVGSQLTRVPSEHDVPRSS